MEAPGEASQKRWTLSSTLKGAEEDSGKGVHSRCVALPVQSHGGERQGPSRRPSFLARTKHTLKEVVEDVWKDRLWAALTITLRNLHFTSEVRKKGLPKIPEHEKRLVRFGL